MLNSRIKEEIYLWWTNRDLGIDTQPYENPERIARLRRDENGILFLVEYLIGLYVSGHLTAQDKAWFVLAQQHLQSRGADGEVIRGLYDRGQGESLWANKENIRTISHDNLRAIFAFSFLIGFESHKEIFEHGKKNFWRFDNVYPERPRFGRMLHPRDIIFICRFGAHWRSDFGYWLFGRIMFPFIPLLQILSCIKEYKVRPTLIDCFKEWRVSGKWPERRKILHTDGKILMVVENVCTMHASFITRWSLYLCHRILRWRFKNDKPFEYMPFIYFQRIDHPVRLSWMGMDKVVYERSIHKEGAGLK